MMLIARYLFWSLILLPTFARSVYSLRTPFIKINECHKNIIKNIEYNFSRAVEKREIDKYIPNFKNKKITLDLSHIVLGTINNNKLSGLHTSKYCTNEIKKVLVARNKDGIADVIWGIGALKKRSTLFPEEWDEETISKKILESLIGAYHICNKGSILCILGKTLENITIESRICPYHGEIKTSFPLLRNNHFN